MKKTKRRRDARRRSGDRLFRPDERPVKWQPRLAAVLRKLGQHVDSRDVAGVDDNLLSKEDAAELRAAGVEVRDEEIAED